MIDVLCIGHSAYDITVPLNEYPMENMKYSVSKIIECGGGPAGNAAYLLSKWGVNTGYIGLLGDDVYGNNIIKEFKDVGVDVSLVCVKDNYPTPLSTIIVNTSNGSRTIINRKEPHEDIAVDADELRKMNPKVILVDGHELKTSLEAIEMFPHSKTIIDAGSLKKSTEELAAIVDYLVCSERFALDYCKMKSLETKADMEICFNKLKKLNRNNIVVTLGERGLIYEKDNRMINMPAFGVKAIDTTGAGDIFHGAFAYGVLKEFDLEYNLRFSSMTSALSVTKFGGRTSIPELEEVNAKLIHLS
ncbi:putative sugar kinase yihV [Proteiniborus sp. DW1]|uniref:PfkB family carbohydrate kinase n=1 Tax=Proteiniborus sp. DW1 TaxID=1889883 RepID=UPI00092E0605|nr:PfkB family carbohydrate kinase [Proteiniborus sp. DW1]SCG84381.1 putative sugar kinase yihV [Proteiniborus sp. DW1]